MPGTEEILAQWVFHVPAALVHQRSQQEISTVLNRRHGDEDDAAHHSGFASHGFSSNEAVRLVIRLTLWMNRTQVWSPNQGAEFSHRRNQMEFARKLEEEVKPVVKSFNPPASIRRQRIPTAHYPASKQGWMEARLPMEKAA
jgi:hypothetical protein